MSITGEWYSLPLRSFPAISCGVPLSVVPAFNAGFMIFFVKNLHIQNFFCTFAPAFGKYFAPVLNRFAPKIGEKQE